MAKTHVESYCVENELGLSVLGFMIGTALGTAPILVLTVVFLISKAFAPESLGQAHWLIYLAFPILLALAFSLQLIEDAPPYFMEPMIAGAIATFCIWSLFLDATLYPAFIIVGSLGALTGIARRKNGSPP